MPLDQRITKSFKAEEVSHKWFLVDASGQTLGRVASRIAHILRGKHKPIFTTNVDTGDFVVVVNAEKVRVSGKRATQKEYFHHTGYPGGARVETYQDLIKTKPERVLEHAVRGMIPHNKLGRRVIMKLKVYAGPSHPHAAQKPEPIKF